MIVILGQARAILARAGRGSSGKAPKAHKILAIARIALAP